MISILLLGTQMATGGAQEILLAQALWFSSRGYRVTVAFLYDKEGLFQEYQSRLSGVEQGIETSAAPTLVDIRSYPNLFRLLRGPLRLYRLLRDGHFDVIETFTHHANLLGLPLAWLAGVPVRVASHHGKVENFTQPLQYLHTQLINHGFATDLVVVSERVRRLAIETEHIYPDRITVIENGIPSRQPSTFGCSSPTNVQLSNLRQSLGIADNAPLLLTVARLKTQKGHTYLLEAIPDVHKVYPDAVFVFAGDGPLHHELLAKAQALEIDGAVRFLGIRKDIPELMKAADIFVLPSLWEGLPVAMLEAMLAGLPIAATRVEGVEEVIQDGVTGLLVPPAVPGPLSEIIIRLLNDQALRNHLGAAGKELVEQEYTIDRMCHRYESLFLDRLRSNHGRGLNRNQSESIK